MKNENISKNTFFNTGDNLAADNILLMIESLDIISEKFKLRINNIVLAILTNFDGNKQHLTDMIYDIHVLMNITCIFSDEFKISVIAGLQEALKFEADKRKKIRNL